MADGRTYWWAKDAAWWDRDRVADLALMFGPIGPAALDWLCCHAKALNDDGYVKSGYSAIAKGIGSKPDEVRAAVLYAVEIGALDEFSEAEDRRFTCLISGWEADHQRGVKSMANARAHAAKVSRSSVGGQYPSVQDRERESTEETTDEANASPTVATEIAELCELLASSMLLADPKAKTAADTVGWQRDMRLLVERDKRTPDEVGRVLDYIFDEGFWIPLVRSPAALRKRFDQIAAQAARKPAQRGRKIEHAEERMPDKDEQAVILAAYEARAAVKKTADSGNSNPDREYP